MTSSLNGTISKDGLKEERRHMFPFHSGMKTATQYPSGWKLSRGSKRRDRWLVDGKLELIIDETDFGHLVGKVEVHQLAKGGGKKFNQDIAAFYLINQTLGEKLRYDVEGLTLRRGRTSATLVDLPQSCGLLDQSDTPRGIS